MNKLPDFDRAILGLNYSGYHDSAIALVSLEGKVIYACALERLSRVKQDGRPPDLLLEKIPWDKITAIAVSTDEKLEAPADPASKLHPVPLKGEKNQLIAHGQPFYDYLATLKPRKKFVCHQFSHAASAFYLSGFTDSLVLVYDGGMSNCAWFGGLYRANRDNGIEPLDRFAASHYAKITSLYSVVTGLLGFSPNKHEGKITGLAAYGKPNAKCRELLHDLYSNHYFDMEGMVEWYGVYSKEEPPVLAVNAARREKILQRFADISRDDIAATVQEMAEEHIIAILKKARELGCTSDSICLAGGLFANVKINQRVKQFGFKNVFVAPPMTDDGTALGAAFAVAAAEKSFKPEPARHMFLGPAYSAPEIEKTLHEFKLKFSKIEKPAELLADELASGAVIGVFQGAMEFGPRALGHRSMLSEAKHASINKELNTKLNRTEFMPFAPMTRTEDAAACYKDLHGAEHTAAFMTITCACTPAMEKASPAVVHVDGTARPQLVDKETNPLIYDILSHYRQKTGISSIVNTSFNIHEEPIVCSPADAIEGFLGSGIELLYLEGGYLVRFAENHEAALTLLQKNRGAKSQKEVQLAYINRKISDYSAILEADVAKLLKICDERLKLIESQHAKVQSLEAKNPPKGKRKWISSLWKKKKPSAKA